MGGPCRRPGGMSRVELAQRTGLTAQTVGTLCRRLIEERLIREPDRVNTDPGKPRRLLALMLGGRYAVGVHIDPAVLTFLLLDIEGAVVPHARLPMPAGPPERVISAIAAQAHVLMQESGVDPTRMLELGPPPLGKSTCARASSSSRPSPRSDAICPCGARCRRRPACRS